MTKVPVTEGTLLTVEQDVIRSPDSAAALTHNTALERIEVKGVQWLTELEHDVVGDIDDCID